LDITLIDIWNKILRGRSDKSTKEPQRLMGSDLSTTSIKHLEFL